VPISIRISIPAVALVVLIGCGSAAPIQDLLYVSAPRGVAVVSAGARTAARVRAPGGIPSPNWSTIVRAIRNGRETRLVATNPSSGAELWAKTLKGKFQIKIVSADGTLVAVAPVREPNYRVGRQYTDLIVVGRYLVDPMTFRLNGNFEPEAFSTDGGSLFVLKYMPAQNPDRYQVRRLDFETEQILRVFTVDAELQRAMRGTARIQTMSQDGLRLYTLYTVRGDDGLRHAFIHVLSLDELWAHCVDLPGEFAESPESTALTAAQGGKYLYVANSRESLVAKVDTKSLRVVQTAEVPFGYARTPHAAYGANGTLVVASGSTVVSLRAATLAKRRSWSTDDRIKGIQLGLNSGRAYIGLRDRVMVIDLLSGRRLKTFDPPGVRRIRRLGPVAPSLPDPSLDKA
jgi:outer membrane protein assembly factor BamB